MSELPLTAFDLIVLVVLLLSAVVSLARGAVREILGLLSWVGAFAAAYYGFGEMRPIIREAVGNDLLTDLLTAALVFLVPFIVLRLLASMVARRVEHSGAGAFDRLMGLLFGLARGAFLVAAGYLVAVILLDARNMPSWVVRGYTHPYVSEGARWLGELLPERLAEQAKSTAEEAVERARTIRERSGYPEDANRALEKIIEGER